MCITAMTYMRIYASEGEREREKERDKKRERGNAYMERTSKLITDVLS